MSNKDTRQTGKSNTFMDKRFMAKKPGKRKTSWGTTYYERRKNRSDRNPKRRL
jgi:hypothetical protein